MQGIFCLWQLHPVRIECEGGTAAWVMVMAPCAGTWAAPVTGITALSESFFEPLVACNQKASLASLSL